MEQKEKCNPDEHVFHFYPLKKEVKQHSVWDFKYLFSSIQVTYHWYCAKCGTELEPVFREKIK